MMNFDTKSVDQYHSDAERFGASRAGDFKVSTFSEVHSSVRDMMLKEGLSTSESRVMNPRLDEQLNLINDLTGSYPGAIQEKTLHGFSRQYKEQMLDESKDLINQLKLKNPEAGFKTIDDILNETKAETRIVREKSIRTMLQAEGVSNLGMVTGTMRAVLEDPIIVGSMAASALFTKGVGATATSRALGIAKSEALIGSISEAMIQPGVYSWKKRIESPYSIQEAATNIVIAGGLGAILGAGGSLVYDAATFRKAARLKEVTPDEAEILNRYADELDTKPKDVDLQQHFDAVDKVSQDIDEGIEINIDQVIEKPEPPVEPVKADTVTMDGVSARAMADIAYMRSNDIPEFLKRQSDAGQELIDDGKIPEMLKRQSGSGIEDKPVKAPMDKKARNAEDYAIDQDTGMIVPADPITEKDMIKLQAEENIAINSQMDELRKADFDVPVEQTIDADGEITVNTKKASELFDEIEADEQSLDGIIKCYGGVQ